MSTIGMNVANIEFDAAQALLDLQSSIPDSKIQNYDRNESVETANLFLSCFISSNVSKASINASTSTSKIGSIHPKYALSKSTSMTSEIEIKQSPKRKNPEPELTTAVLANTIIKADSINKRPKAFKRKPIQHFTVTAGPSADATAHRISNFANKDNKGYVPEKPPVKTRDVATQTDEKLMMDSVGDTITKLCDKIKDLENQIKEVKSNSQYLEKMKDEDSDHDGDYDDDDDDESFKVTSKDVTMGDSNTSDTDLNETFTEPETPEKVKPKQKTGQNHEYNTARKVLSNRNINANADNMVPIGEGKALIPTRIFRHVNWNSYTSATRKLLTAVFSRRVLATHSLTGKPSPAFPNKPAKKKLDPSLVNDIVQTVVERCCVPENVVRTSITTKCADESKMFRTRQNNKKKRKQKVNRENIPPETDSDEF